MSVCSSVCLSVFLSCGLSRLSDSLSFTINLVLGYDGASDAVDFEVAVGGVEEDYDAYNHSPDLHAHEVSIVKSYYNFVSKVVCFP